MTEQEEENDQVDAFVKTILTKACQNCGFSFIAPPPGEKFTFLQYHKQEDQVLTVYVTTLGSSVLSITARLEPLDVMRTMTLNLGQSQSVSFVQTHLIEWLMNNGNYPSFSSPHLQGLSVDLLERVSSYLDNPSQRGFRRSNKSMMRIPPSPVAASTMRRTYQYQW